MQHTTHIDVLNWLHSLENTERAALSRLNFIKPFHLVTLGQSIQKLAQTTLQLSPDLEKYAVRMGLWDAIEISAPCNVSSYSEKGKFIPMQSFVDHRQAKDFNWDGTLLVLEWDTRKQLDPKTVYKKWPIPQGFDEDDFL